MKMKTSTRTKEDTSRAMKKMKMTGKKEIMNTYSFDSDNELNGYFAISEFYDNSDNE